MSNISRITGVDVVFGGWRCRIAPATYPNGRLAWQLVDADTGEPVTVATVNLPDHALPEGHVFVKDWSENEGVLSALILSGVVEDTGVRVPSGYVDAAMCRIVT